MKRAAVINILAPDWGPLLRAMSKRVDGRLIAREHDGGLIMSDAQVKDPMISGRDYFQLLYREQVDMEAEWLRRGAIEKVNSIEQLLREHGIQPGSLLELGCGTGAVIVECQKRGLAKRYIAADYSEEAIGHLKKHTTNIETICGDITVPGVFHGQADVVIVSHVLEHLEAPAAFLQALRHMEFSYLIAEVPLEDLFAGKLKSWFWDRTRNTSGHVQFFTVPSFMRLLASNNLDVLGARTYVPILDRETVKFACRKNGHNELQHVKMLITNHYLPRALEPLWKRFYYAHHAVLCRKSIDRCG